MTVVHCTENVLTSGGVMKLFEARDAFYAGGATFERAQIVRLDARWIAMLRYHLGTGFEDIYIPGMCLSVLIAGISFIRMQSKNNLRFHPQLLVRLMLS